MRIRKRVPQIVAAGFIATAALKAGASQCNFKQIFTRPDEKGTAIVKVFEAKAVSLPNDKGVTTK